MAKELLLARERLKLLFLFKESMTNLNMTGGKNKTKNLSNQTNSDSETAKTDFQKLLEKDHLQVPQAGDIVKGIVMSASRSEVKLDIDGIYTGVVRGRELYFEADEYANLKPGDEVEATVIEVENENGELELSFKNAGQQKAWSNLLDAYQNKKIIKVKVADANRGGLIISYGQIQGFLPVSQLAPENYPRVDGGDKGKILEKLKTFMGTEFEVKIMTLEEREEKLIVSEKDAWQEKQKDTIAKYQLGKVVEGKITAITDFGVFVSFGENLEGLIHISELAWQRIDDPADLFKIGDRLQAEIISIDGAKIFLSAKKLIEDPWREVAKKYQIGQPVIGTILKINPFGLFVELDKDIHGLAHISQLNLPLEQKISEVFKVGEKEKFTIVTIEPENHRLGLARFKEKKPVTQAETKKIKAEKPAMVTKIVAEKPIKDKKITAAKKDEKKEAVAEKPVEIKRATKAKAGKIDEKVEKVKKTKK